MNASPATTAPTAAWIELAGAKDPAAALIRVEQESARAASELITDSMSVVDLSPGNGYRYAIVLTLLPEDTVLPGRLMVSLPDFHVCALMDPTGFHMPHYIAEKMSFTDARHAAFVAVLTTLVSSHLAGLL